MNPGTTPDTGERSAPFKRLQTVKIRSFEKALARKQRRPAPFWSST